ncbi:MAG: colicin immunity domain-containing protein [Acidobacteria bacterium]|nr:colicin immunity domain-containing protein [Acidobacteriota bacterium]
MAPEELAELHHFQTLVHSFLEGRSTADGFTGDYFQAFGDTQRIWGKEIHGVLEDMFFALEGYQEDPALRDSGDLDEAALRRAAEQAATKLGAILSREEAEGRP